MDVERFRSNLIILTPSLSSVLGSVFLALGLMTLSGLNFSSQTGTIYSYWLGSSGNLVQASASDGVEVYRNTVFGNPTLNKILFFVFWMLLGLIAYLLISGVGSGLGSVQKNQAQMGYTNVDQKAMRSNLRLRIILRLVAVFAIILYGSMFFRVLLPFAQFCSHILAGNLNQVSSWLYGLLGFVVLSISLFIFIVLLRFLILKPRVYGGWQDKLAQDMQHRIR